MKFDICHRDDHHMNILDPEKVVHLVKSNWTLQETPSCAKKTKPFFKDQMLKVWFPFLNLGLSNQPWSRLTRRISKAS